MASFYFEKDNSEPTGYTVQKLNALKSLMQSHNLQVIEIDAFSDAVGSVELNRSIAKKRAEFILHYFSLDSETLEVSIYGNKRVPLNFRPHTWHRVDMYYFVGELKKPTTQVRDSIEEIVAIEPSEEKASQPVPKLEEIVENIPIVLAIEFQGGTNKIKRSAQPRLEQLFETMQRHPVLHLHIRGHVCCGNNKRISKKRAKVVYKYLKERGVEPERMSFKGYSNNEPLVFPEVTAADRAANRRVDVIFSKPVH